MDDAAITQLLKDHGGSQSIKDYKFFHEHCFPHVPNDLWVEIGSRFGTSTYIFGTELKKRGGTLYCYEPYPTIAWLWNMTRAGLQDTVVLIEEESPPKTSKLPSPPGFAFIDGDHRYWGVRRDFLFWWPKMAPGGILAMHDYEPNTPKHGVIRVVKEMGVEPFAEYCSGVRGIIAFRKE